MTFASSTSSVLRSKSMRAQAARPRTLTLRSTWPGVAESSKLRPVGPLRANTLQWRKTRCAPGRSIGFDAIACSSSGMPTRSTMNAARCEPSSNSTFGSARRIQLLNGPNCTRPSGYSQRSETWSSRPMVPSRRCARRRSYAGMKRKLWLTARRRPLASARSASAWQAAADVPIGFSISACAPPSNTWRARSVCSCGGTSTCTASTPERSISSTEVKTPGMPWLAAAASARVFETSQTAASVALGNARTALTCASTM